MAFGTIGFGFSASGSGGGGGGLASISANNGLSANTISNTQLGSTTNSGSPLIHNTFLNLAGFNFTINGGATATYNLLIENVGVNKSEITIDSTSFNLQTTTNATDVVAGLDITSSFGGAASLRRTDTTTGFYNGFYFLGNEVGWNVTDNITQYEYHFPPAPYVSNSVLADISGTGFLTWTPISSLPPSTPTGYYGAFSDITNQTATLINTGYPMKFALNDIPPNGISIVNNALGDKTRITFANTGIYNLQWSAQFLNIDNTSEHDVSIWLRKNEIDVVGSRGLISVPRKSGTINGHTLPSWNFVLSVVAGEYYEFVWSTASLDVSIVELPATAFSPSTASSILTVTQQSGIMAGTGITGMGTSGNIQTGAIQTLATGTSGTDFAIVSSTNTQTFNLPTASATNRGALQSSDFTNFQTAYTNRITSLTTTGTGAATLISNVLNIPTNTSTFLAFKNVVDGAASSGTTNTFSQSVLVTANSIVTGNVVEFKMRGRKTGATGLWTIRLYANTTNNLSGTPILLATYTATSTNAIGMQLIRTAAIKNATSNTEMALSTATNPLDYGNTSFASIVVDWTTDKYIIGAVQNVSATDSTLISYISMTIV